MRKLTAPTAALAMLMLPLAASAKPITLKCSFYSSDRSMTYQSVMKPFIEAVTAASNGTITFDIHFSGALEKDIAKQPQLVREGRADIAFAIPGYTPDAFPDNTILEMPGLFRDMTEASLAYTRLVAANALAGYDDFYVIGAYVAEAQTIHGRIPIGAIADLKGKKIRVNNPGQGYALAKLGAIPVPVQINKISLSLSSGAIDAALVPLGPLADFGIKRIATYHYLLGVSGAPMALLMNRKTFEALPEEAKGIIRRFSGDWAAKRFVEVRNRADEEVLKDLRTEPQRTVITPSPTDEAAARDAFRAVYQEWRAESPTNETLAQLTNRLITHMRRADPPQKAAQR